MEMKKIEWKVLCKILRYYVFDRTKKFHRLVKKLEKSNISPQWPLKCTVRITQLVLSE